MAQELCSGTASGNILKKPILISSDPPFKGRYARYKTKGTTLKPLSEKKLWIYSFSFFCEMIIFNLGFSLKITC